VQAVNAKLQRNGDDQETKDLIEEYYTADADRAGSSVDEECRLYRYPSRAAGIAPNQLNNSKGSNPRLLRRSSRLPRRSKRGRLRLPPQRQWQ
jgi:hypothetical protein